MNTLPIHTAEPCAGHHRGATAGTTEQPHRAAATQWDRGRCWAQDFFRNIKKMCCPSAKRQPGASCPGKVHGRKMFESLQRSINKLESSLMSKREDSKTHTHTQRSSITVSGGLVGVALVAVVAGSCVFKTHPSRFGVSAAGNNLWSL